MPSCNRIRKMLYIKYRKRYRKLRDVIRRQIQNGETPSVRAAEIDEAQNRVGYEEEACPDKEEKRLHRFVIDVCEDRLKQNDRKEEIVSTTYEFELSNFFEAFRSECDKGDYSHYERADERIDRESRDRIECGEIEEVPEPEKRHSHDEESAVVRAVAILELHENVADKPEYEPENAKKRVRRVLV